jgi:hypothetical protein
MVHPLAALLTNFKIGSQIMNFALLLIYLFIYIVRPSEWVPGMIGTPLLMVVGVISVAAIIFGVISGRTPNVLSGDVEKMMLGFIVAISLSHLSHGYVGGAINSMEKFLPSMVGFFLVLTSVNDRKKLNIMILVLIALVSLVAYEGIQQYKTGYAIGGLESIFENATSADGERIKLGRIRWYGLFNDPNDLGLLLIIVFPFIINMLMQRKLVVPLISLFLVISALYHTNSRGSMLAGAISICSFFLIRYRSKKGFMLGLALIVPLLLLGPSRMGDMSGKEESAYGRIESWHQGYQMFKSNPLFGVGMGSYTDYHELTAHNSFVLVMAELGFVGLFFFTGLIYFPLYWLYTYITRLKYKNIDHIDNGLICSSYASLFGILTAMFFLSRSYMLIPYLLIAIVISTINICYKKFEIDSTDIMVLKSHYKNVALLSVAQIVCINIVVKIIL